MMCNVLLSVFILQLLQLFRLCQGKACLMNVGSDVMTPPVFLTTINATKLQIVDRDGYISIDPNHSLTATCPSTSYIAINGTIIKARTLLIACIDDDSLSDETVNMRLSCRKTYPLVVSSHHRQKRGIFTAFAILIGKIIAVSAKTAAVVSVPVGSSKAVIGGVVAGGVIGGVLVAREMNKLDPPPFIPDSPTSDESSSAEDEPCRLRMAVASPLVLDYVAGQLTYVYPTNQMITMEPGQKLYITCGQGLIRGFEYNHGELKCKSDVKVYFRGFETTWAEITCNEGIAESTIRPKFWTPACIGGIQQSIGWNYGNQFVDQIYICHDLLHLNTIFTKHILKKTNFYPRFTGGNRPSFEPQGGAIDGGYLNFGNRLRRVYNIMNGHISRGHLAANSDFIYPCQRSATFYYVNALPQWVEINDGPWERMENLIQRTRSTNDLIVYTGGNKQDMTAEGTRISMLDRGVAPLPLYFWKIVYNPETRRATGFIGLNSLVASHSSNVLREFGCAGICRRANWEIPENRNHIGLVFCCPYANMANQIPAVRRLNLQVAGLLNYVA